ncbi:MAG: hypothetical protein LBS57_02945, partial [Treponema sp.]|nr:hypothetical protein [Treponema sp.]
MKKNVAFLVCVAFLLAACSGKPKQANSGGGGGGYPHKCHKNAGAEQTFATNGGGEADNRDS